jgi:hypothetical protein
MYLRPDLVRCSSNDEQAHTTDNVRTVDHGPSSLRAPTSTQRDGSAARRHGGFPLALRLGLIVARKGHGDQAVHGGVRALRAVRFAPKRDIGDTKTSTRRARDEGRKQRPRRPRLGKDACEDGHCQPPLAACLEAADRTSSCHWQRARSRNADVLRPKRANGTSPDSQPMLRAPRHRSTVTLPPFTSSWQLQVEFTAATARGRDGPETNGESASKKRPRVRSTRVIDADGPGRPLSRLL